MLASSGAHRSVYISVLAGEYFEGYRALGGDFLSPGTLASLLSFWFCLRKFSYYVIRHACLVPSCGPPRIAVSGVAVTFLLLGTRLKRL